MSIITLAACVAATMRCAREHRAHFKPLPSQNGTLAQQGKGSFCNKSIVSIPLEVACDCGQLPDDGSWPLSD